MIINANITYENLARAMIVQMGEGAYEEDAYTILQAIGYTLLGVELFPDDDEFDYDALMEMVADLRKQMLVDEPDGEDD